MPQLHVFPKNMLYAVPYLPLCSVSCNTLLANLNARGYIGGEAIMTRQVSADVITNASAAEGDDNKTNTQCEEPSLEFSPQEVRFSDPLIQLL